MKKRLLLPILLLCFSLCLVSCGPSEGENQGGQDPQAQTEEERQVASKKAQAKQNANQAFAPSQGVITEQSLLSSLSQELSKIIAHIDSVTTIEEANELETYLETEIQSYIQNTFKPLFKAEVTKGAKALKDYLVSADKLSAIDLLITAYETSVDGCQSLSDIVTVYSNKQQLQTSVQTIVDGVITALKNVTIGDLETFYNNVKDLIKTGQLKTAIEAYLQEGVAKINAVVKEADFQASLAESKDIIINGLIVKAKELSLSLLDSNVKPLITSIKNDSIKTLVQTFYNDTVAVINTINSKESAISSVDGFEEMVKEFVKNTLKPAALSKLDTVINPLIEGISHTELKTSVESLYTTIKGNLNVVESIEDMDKFITDSIDDVKDFIKEETEKIILALYNEALTTLDPYVNSLIDSIPYESLEVSLRTFYQEELKVLKAVSKIEDFPNTLEELKDNLVEYIIVESKKLAIEQINTLVTNNINKIKVKSVREELTALKDDAIADINAIKELGGFKTAIKDIYDDLKDHIQNYLDTQVKGFLSSLLEAEDASPYDYLPDSMKPNYAANVVNMSDITTDFTSFVSVSAIPTVGFGEQWQLVIDTIEGSEFKNTVLNAIQTILGSVTTIVTTYIDETETDSLSKEINGSNFTGLFTYQDGLLYVKVALSTALSLPVVGNVSPVIEMEYNTNTESKVVYVSSGENFAVKYIISPNKYELSVGYYNSSVSAFVTSLLSLTIDESEKITGHIYEYMSAEGVTIKSACCDFYIDNSYVVVIGNKADAMKTAKGYICELYSKQTGRLLGYEVREDQSGTGRTFNTLFYNLVDISGINNVKVEDSSEFINNSESKMKNTLYWLSRSFYIELRTRYVYSYDSSTETYVKNTIEIPMFAIQEEKFDKFEEEMYDKNKVSCSVIMNSSNMTYLMAKYDSLVPVFITNKDKITKEVICTYLGIEIKEE